MTTLEISEPIRGIVTAPQSSIAHRDEVLATTKAIVSVTTPDELEIAVAALRELTSITKETESARKTIKQPALELGKQIDTVAANHVAPVEKEKARLTNIVNAYQRKQLEEQQARERAARAEQEKANREAVEAQRKIEEAQRKLANEELTNRQRAATEAALLASQLAAEEAALNQQSASLELTAPTNTPRGLTTRVRYDFEITNAVEMVVKMPARWTWQPGTESLKFDRAGFLKSLNSETDPSNLLPPDGQQSIQYTFGLRVYRDVSTHVRS